MCPFVNLHGIVEVVHGENDISHDHRRQPDVRQRTRHPHRPRDAGRPTEVVHEPRRTQGRHLDADQHHVGIVLGEPLGEYWILLATTVLDDVQREQYVSHVEDEEPSHCVSRCHVQHGM